MAVAAAIALSSPINAQDDTPETFPSPNEIVDQATPEDWVTIPTEDLLVMDLAPDHDGNARRVVIQLMPAPFSQGWVENIKLMARDGYYDGLSVIRVQDNYVVQWGDPAEEEEDAKPLPDGLKVMEESEYSVQSIEIEFDESMFADNGGPFERPTFVPSPNLDQYVETVNFRNGWPIGDQDGRAAPVHCYGMVGVGRGLSPNTGDGSSLYTVIGHAPRHLDRNIALVGRIIEGMEHLSSLPRGHGPLGFYGEGEEDKRTEITSVQIASDLNDHTDLQFEYLSTESDTFAKYTEARANRRDPFFIQPAGGADICNIPVPIRKFDATDAVAE